MTTFSIQNFGCRATDADASLLKRQLLAGGFALVGDHSSADVVVLNTCTVTAAADAQARDTVRKVHRANPSARIVVAGCYAQRAPEEVASLPGVELVVGNSRLAEIAYALADGPRSEPPRATTHLSARGPRESNAAFVDVSQLAQPMSLARGPAKILTADVFAQDALAGFVSAGDDTSVQPGAGAGFRQDVVVGVSPLHDRTRPILKIQDGCNNRCSYCVIPFVRGCSRSLPPDAVIREIRGLLSVGAREIVLSGINLGSYGRDLTPRKELRTLVRRILAETELERLRFSSIEPQDVTQDFVELVASSERIARHFHVPMQSGSDRILKAMHRWYRAEHYAERIRLIRAMLPDAGIGADVIAGFPRETDEDFAATVALIEELPFTYLHAFSFSARPGTEAARMDSQLVNGNVIRERARALRALGEKKASAFRVAQDGQTVRALTLRRSSQDCGQDWTEALTGNYLKVRVAGRRAANQWCDARITKRADEVASAEAATPALSSKNRSLATRSAVQ